MGRLAVIKAAVRQRFDMWREPTPPLPSDLRYCTLRSRRFGISYRIALSRLPSAYEQAVASSQGPDKNTQLIMALLDGRGCLVDVGAHIGTVAVPVAKCGSHVIAIEMNPDNWARLQASIDLNGLERMRIVKTAASDSDGEVHFSGTEAWGQITTDPGARRVTCFRIDTILDRSPSLARGRTIFKVDVEGHELAVFRGAVRTIDTHRPVILFESIDVEGQEPSGAIATREFLSELGYALFLLRGSVLSPKKPSDVHEGLVCDYLAVPQEEAAGFHVSGFEVRALTMAERLDWLEEMMCAEDVHQRHAVGVALRWQREEPAMFEACRHSVEALVQRPHLRDLKPMLAGCEDQFS